MATESPTASNDDLEDEVAELERELESVREERDQLQEKTLELDNGDRVAESAVEAYWNQRVADSDYIDVGDTRVYVGHGEEDAPTIEPPAIKSGGLWSVVSTWRHQRKLRKLADKGYVIWYLVDDGWPNPRLVRPTALNGGIPEKKVDGETYLFPKQGGAPSKRNGMWTFVHTKADATPINIREADEFAVPPDVLTEYLEKRPTASKPSWFANWDMDPSDLLTWAFAVGAVLIVAWYMLGNVL